MTWRIWKKRPSIMWPNPNTMRFSAEAIAEIQRQSLAVNANLRRLALERVKEEKRHVVTLMDVVGTVNWEGEALLADISHHMPAPVEAFAALRKAVGDAWDGVDVEAYLREVRDEG